MTAQNRVFNFSAGPAALPESILLEAQSELLNWHNSGMSILEMGHRTDAVKTLMAQAESNLRDILNVPDDYHVLFLGGASRTQFAQIPMNFVHPHQKAGYFVTGLWSSMAYDEARKVSRAYAVCQNGTDVTSIPDKETWEIHENTAYLYYTPNETVSGVQFASTPKIPGIPLIADMTSCLLTESIDVREYGLIFAGAQKNIANAGLTVVIVQESLLGKTVSTVLPTMLDYRTHRDHRSVYATPPVFNCYLALKMFEWVKAQGGLDALYKMNQQKAALLYQAIDTSSFYRCPVANPYRSFINVCFTLSFPALEPIFLAEAQRRGLSALKGHRQVGGIRASLYNAMPLAGVEALVEFMTEFALEHS